MRREVKEAGWPEWGSERGKVAAGKAREMEMGTEHVEEDLSLSLRVIWGVIGAGFLFFKIYLFERERETDRQTEIQHWGRNRRRGRKRISRRLPTECIARIRA